MAILVNGADLHLLFASPLSCGMAWHPWGAFFYGQSGRITWTPCNGWNFLTHLLLCRVCMYQRNWSRSSHLCCRSSLGEGPRTFYPRCARLSWRGNIGLCGKSSRLSSPQAAHANSPIILQLYSVGIENALCSAI